MLYKRFIDGRAIFFRRAVFTPAAAAGSVRGPPPRPHRGVCSWKLKQTKVSAKAKCGYEERGGHRPFGANVKVGKVQVWINESRAPEASRAPHCYTCWDAGDCSRKPRHPRVLHADVRCCGVHDGGSDASPWYQRHPTSLGRPRPESLDPETFRHVRNQNALLHFPGW